ncbi:hypothetical protein [Mongoliibacter ruber]|uniref:Uncharacterized protein n=1 Tax=Mongoliibacter ruber TaxID=1750599 RepID=A0A2T0WHQ0_9BACT|nr:hypothetical protein [Mongoliibacter ruber]PRY86229.1 hypothetical protein CLW00_10975 [Mongoliibacter ruber]
MKKSLAILIIAVFVFGCVDDELKVDLDVNQELAFEGTFQTSGSDEDLFEEVALKISNGFYKTTTSLPFGYGAGKLEVSGNSINFIDTLFFPVPALFGPSYVLSGEHHYEYNGQQLKIWRTKNVGSIEYNLRIME